MAVVGWHLCASGRAVGWRAARTSQGTGSEARSPSQSSVVGIQSRLPGPTPLGLPAPALPNGSALCPPCLGLHEGQAGEGSCSRRQGSPPKWHRK